MKLAEEDYHERHRMKTLMEKITDKYEECLRNKVLLKVNGYYEEVQEFGFIVNEYHYYVIFSFD